jgi:hypothetical protein
VGTHYIADITNNGRLDILENARTYWQGTLSTNNGTVNINPNGYEQDVAVWMWNRTVTMEGSGEFVLRTAGEFYDAQILSYNGGMIQGAAHTIRGEGYITAAMDNYGTITADVPDRVLLLSTNPKTNRNLCQATNNGILQLANATFTQVGDGAIVADGGTVQLLNGATVIRGELRTANGGIVEAYALSQLDDITNLGALELPGGSTVWWHFGESVNDGTISINAEASETDAVVYVRLGTLNLSGSGEIVMRTAGDVDDAQLNWQSGHLIQGPGHTIRREGRILTSLQNDGLVSADVSDRILQCDSGTKTNNSVMQATGGGMLRIQCTVEQAPDGCRWGTAARSCWRRTGASRVGDYGRSTAGTSMAWATTTSAT